MSEQEKWQTRLNNLEEAFNNAPDPRAFAAKAFDAASKALPLITRANIFDPGRGTRLAWYSFAHAMGLPE